MAKHDVLVESVSTPVPQSKPLPGQMKNSAGGHSYQVDKWMQLRRFLILGTEGGTYYIGESKLTDQNIDALKACVAEDGVRTVQLITEISVMGHAPKQDQTLFSLAYCSVHGDTITRMQANAALTKVARIGTHLFQFAKYVTALSGRPKRAEGGSTLGTSSRARAIRRWYLEHPSLELQLAKYRQREEWSHRDILRLTHPRATDPKTAAALAWAAGKGEGTEWLQVVDSLAGLTENELIEAITTNKLPWEVIPSEKLASPKVWQALVPTLGLTALVRNLGRMSANGALDDTKTVRTIIDRLSDREQITKSRIHPMQVLFAQTTYASGGGFRGKLKWAPNGRIIDVLNGAFHSAFKNVVPADKRTLVALDVSGSMGSLIANSNLSARAASAAMALVTLATEIDTHVIAFTSSGWSASGQRSRYGSGGITPLAISGKQRLDDVIRLTDKLSFGGTDCALPMLYADAKGLEIDTFITYTDSETWAGDIHPSEALKRYRKSSGIDSRAVVVGMTSNSFTLADPADPLQLDVVGFDASAPAVIADFSAGRI